MSAGVPVLGWDIGGANIKAARLSGASDALAIVERAFPLWRECARLPAVLVDIADRIGGAPAMAVTMTGELADCFATRREGVAFIVQACRLAFPESAVWIYGVDGTFRSVEQARQQPDAVAAANWTASATLASRNHPDALLIDVGSTTTDLVPIVAGRVVAAGRTDTERLRSGELVYTGCLRTPISAVVRSVPLSQGRCRVAAEYFASAADVYCWLGEIGEADYTCETADGRGRSRAEAGARLARMVCADADRLGADEVTAIATYVARLQTRLVVHAIRQVVRRLNRAAPRAAVVAGSGAFLGGAAAQAAGLDVVDLAADLGRDAARSAPAAAVAILLSELLCTPPR